MSSNPFRRSQPPPALHLTTTTGHATSRLMAGDRPMAASQDSSSRTKPHVQLAHLEVSPETTSTEWDNDYGKHSIVTRPITSPPLPDEDYADHALEQSDDSLGDGDFLDDGAPLRPATFRQAAEGPRTTLPMQRKDSSTDVASVAGIPSVHRSPGSSTQDPMGVSFPSADSRPRPHTAVASSSGTTSASSISTHSIFDPVTRTQDSSSRSSHETAPLQGGSGAESLRSKQKPPLPKHRHGKSIARAPQTVSFSDFSPSLGSFDAKPEPSKQASSHGQRPLPPRPRVLSGQGQKNVLSSSPSDEAAHLESAVESPTPSRPAPDARPLGGSQESSELHRRKPPTPPLARRHSQLKLTDVRLRSNSAATASPRSETPLPSTEATASTTNKQSLPPPPPPPPTRRCGNVSSSVADTNASTTSSSSSRRSTASSVHSSSLDTHTNRLPSFALDLTSSASAGPPGTPPRRISGKLRPQSAGIPPAPRVFGGPEEMMPAGRGGMADAGDGAGRVDLLSELDRLQREIDSLRHKSATKA